MIKGGTNKDKIGKQVFAMGGTFTTVSLVLGIIAHLLILIGFDIASMMFMLFFEILISKSLKEGRESKERLEKMMEDGKALQDKMKEIKKKYERDLKNEQARSKLH